MSRELPKCGQYLYASCAGWDYGRILVVGQDTNGAPVIDIEVFHPDDLLSCDDNGFDQTGLEAIELPEGVNIILKRVQYKLPEGADEDWKPIICNTPGNNCYRCTKLFTLSDTPCSAS